jgi:hypothetical protein
MADADKELLRNGGSCDVDQLRDYLEGLGYSREYVSKYVVNNTRQFIRAGVKKISTKAET